MVKVGVTKLMKCKQRSLILASFSVPLFLLQPLFGQLTRGSGLAWLLSSSELFMVSLLTAKLCSLCPICSTPAPAWPLRASGIPLPYPLEMTLAIEWPPWNSNIFFFFQFLCSSCGCFPRVSQSEVILLLQLIQSLSTHQKKPELPEGGVRCRLADDAPHTSLAPGVRSLRFSALTQLIKRQHCSNSRLQKEATFPPCLPRGLLDLAGGCRPSIVGHYMTNERRCSSLQSAWMASEIFFCKAGSWTWIVNSNPSELSHFPALSPDLICKMFLRWQKLSELSQGPILIAVGLKPLSWKKRSFNTEQPRGEVKVTEHYNPICWQKLCWQINFWRTTVT